MDFINLVERFATEAPPDGFNDDTVARIGLWAVSGEASLLPVDGLVFTVSEDYSSRVLEPYAVHELRIISRFMAGDSVFIDSPFIHDNGDIDEFNIYLDSGTYLNSAVSEPYVRQTIDSISELQRRGQITPLQPPRHLTRLADLPDVFAAAAT